MTWIVWAVYLAGLVYMALWLYGEYLVAKWEGTARAPRALLRLWREWDTYLALVMTLAWPIVLVWAGLASLWEESGKEVRLAVQFLISREQPPDSGGP